MGRTYSRYFCPMNSRASQSKKPTLTTVVTLLKTLINQLDQKFESKFDMLQHDVKDIRETVEFLKDNALMREEAVTKDEFMGLKNEVTDLKKDVATKNDWVEFKSDVIGHIDHFVQLHKKQEVELVSVAHRVTRHEEVFHGKS